MRRGLLDNVVLMDHIMRDPLILTSVNVLLKTLNGTQVHVPLIGFLLLKYFICMFIYISNFLIYILVC